jgi:hypothetical protein
MSAQPILTFAMPDYGRVAEKKKTSYLTSMLQWFRLKKYQYEVTFSLYMLTSTEKFIFSMSALATVRGQVTDCLPPDLILFLLVSLLVTAATLYLPSHIAVIYNRMSYYVHGEYAYNASGQTISLAKEGLKATAGTVAAAMTGAAKEALKEL